MPRSLQTSLNCRILQALLNLSCSLMPNDELASTRDNSAPNHTGFEFKLANCALAETLIRVFLFYWPKVALRFKSKDFFKISCCLPVVGRSVLKHMVGFTSETHSW